MDRVTKSMWWGQMGLMETLEKGASEDEQVLPWRMEGLGRQLHEPRPGAGNAVAS